MNIQINQSQVLDIIRQGNGRIFSTTFMKKDDSLRTMTARLGVKKNLKGGNNPIAHIVKYLSVFDMHARGYRTINLDTMFTLKVNSITYDIN